MNQILSNLQAAFACLRGRGVLYRCAFVEIVPGEFEVRQFKGSSYTSKEPPVYADWVSISLLSRAESEGGRIFIRGVHDDPAAYV